MSAGAQRCLLHLNKSLERAFEESAVSLPSMKTRLMRTEIRSQGQFRSCWSLSEQLLFFIFFLKSTRPQGGRMSLDQD